MSISVTPVLVVDLGVEGERIPLYVHVIDHPDARVLVDTGIEEIHPLTSTSTHDPVRPPSGASISPTSTSS